MANASRTTTAPLTERQRRAIRSQMTRLSIDDPTYRQALAAYPCVTAPPSDGTPWPRNGQPCTSSRHLTRSQARHLITRWTLAGAPVGGTYSGHRATLESDQTTGVITMPTPAQRRLIDRLIPEITWRTADGYHAWLRTRMRLDPAHAPRTYHEAEAIIEGLRAMRDRPRVTP